MSTTSSLPNRGPVPGVYTAVVFLNTDRTDDGYRPDRPLVEVTRPDGSPLRLTFRSVTSREAAAAAAWDVASHIGADDSGQMWPTAAPGVFKGEIVKVTGPDHLIAYFRGDPFATFTIVPEPTNVVSLERPSGGNAL